MCSSSGVGEREMYMDLYVRVYIGKTPKSSPELSVKNKVWEVSQMLKVIINSGILGFILPQAHQSLGREGQKGTRHACWL
jgi:hypothetical protein